MANIKITGYAELAAPISTDLVEVVSDPGGTPISKKVQIRSLFKGGGQIAFPATAVPSADPNTLDDYEEGYHTATLTCGTSGTITMLSTQDLLAYTKLGRAITVIGSIRVNSVSSPVGSLRLGIPFTSANLQEISESIGGGLSYGNINAIGSGGGLALFGGVASYVTIIEQTTTTWLFDVANHIKAASELNFSFTYFTD